MRDETRAVFELLSQTEWFHAVGTGEPHPQKLQVYSWAEALEHCFAGYWWELACEAVDRFRAKVADASAERFREWDQIAAEMECFTKALVLVKTIPVVPANGLPGEFVGRVQWDLQHLAMELEHRDIVGPGFYTGISYFYLEGNFPCGWVEGRPPVGRMVVY